MAIKGVLFDFSGTLFRIESVTDWLRAALDETGVSVGKDAFERYARELDAAGALPGGSTPELIPEALAELWWTRDQDGRRHRDAYVGLARRVELPDPRLYDALYERHKAPSAWRPYPDAAEVLDGLRRLGTGVAVVSNIGWDPRPVFRAHGLDGYVDAYVLSYRHGVQKPDARLFRAGCEALGQEPRDVLMVGDDRRADGGAARLGCAVHFVDHLPVEERPEGLRPVLGLVGG
ncbi:HAD family hydrolase [Streptomyces sp. ICN441]|uniref:Hydrolase n=1 Tax=Streptomyces tirandamycinicus TaxID=2174846 RepID=A0A2S1SMH8_9ACTN|nr:MULTISPECIES: HAD family hydrolase [Streptomyces]AWI27589.1 hydrolase [Streptomyces tirandamycinicus]NNJ04493.1 HAD family hydrolase [Streptomyces sp. PKU-MA01144]TFE43429.1 HAD family hydrolase [Streptomyces sp. ICN441]